MNDNPTGHILSWIGNGASGIAIITTMFGWLPPAAALIAIIWYGIQILESATVQRWVYTRRQRRLEVLRAKIAEIEAKTIPPRLTASSEPPA